MQNSQTSYDSEVAAYQAAARVGFSSQDIAHYDAYVEHVSEAYLNQLEQEEQECLRDHSDGEVT